MAQVERLATPQERAAALEEAGAADHGGLIDEEGRLWLRVRAAGGDERGRRALRAAAAGDGLDLWLQPQPGGGFILSGERAAFQSALLRWPKSAAEAGEAIARELELPVRLLEPTRIGGREWVWGERTYVMGVLNVTPDSFSDGGKYVDVDAAVARALEMEDEGADLIDIGGESTRPGAAPVGAEEELRRVIPVIEALAGRLSAPLSIDTRKAAVAAAAVEAGAAMINDIGGLQKDPDMARVAAQTGVPVVAMHMQGEPRTMQEAPHYDRLIPEIAAYLERSCELGMTAGVPPENLIIDPGIGLSFGKRLEDNLLLMRRLRRLRRLGQPILVGTSRKSFIGRVLDVGVEERFEGTAATVALAVAALADIVRVHDVGAMRRVCAMADAVVRRVPGEGT